jgi:hypothetical protein
MTAWSFLKDSGTVTDTVSNRSCGASFTHSFVCSATPISWELATTPDAQSGPLQLATRLAKMDQLLVPSTTPTPCTDCPATSINSPLKSTPTDPLKVTGVVQPLIFDLLIPLFKVAFAVYEDFANYQSGVYSHQSGSLLGYHAVKNIGWGVSGGTKYWIIQNVSFVLFAEFKPDSYNLQSWNTSWGMNGFFLIKRGTDEVN